MSDEAQDGSGREQGPDRSGRSSPDPATAGSDKLRGKELAAYLEEQRKHRIGRQPRGVAAYGAGGPIAVGRRRDKADDGDTFYDELIFDERRHRRQSTVVRGTLVAAGLLIVLFVVTALRTHDAVSLATSCTSAAFSTSSDSVRTKGPLQYKFTGPAGQYALSARPTSGTATATVVTPIRELKDCRARGAFSVNLTPGTYTLSLVRIDSPLTNTPDTKQLTVTAS